jgi:hypothetical protein
MNAMFENEENLYLLSETAGAFANIFIEGNFDMISLRNYILCFM